MIFNPEVTFLINQRRSLLLTGRESVRAYFNGGRLLCGGFRDHGSDCADDTIAFKQRFANSTD